MRMDDQFLQEEYHLIRNPFPPAASGIELGRREPYVPKEWKEKVENYYSELRTGSGVKAFPVIGEYGTGKTVFLNGYLKRFFEQKNILSIYFENPGTQFYDLLNELLRSIGRYEFSKAIWELSKEHMAQRKQRTLFEMTYSDYLNQLKKKSDKIEKTKELQDILKRINLTDDDEIAYRIATIVVDTSTKPYFEHKDFIAGRKDAVVAERQEDKYFKAIINAIKEIYNVDGVALLIDEFEDVAISRRMTRSASFEYLATLRKLIQISQDENVWIVMAMTPQAAEITKSMNEALWERFTHDEKNTIILHPMELEEATDLYRWWLDLGRGDQQSEHQGTLYPFNENVLDIFSADPKLRNPRTLVKIGFFTIAKAMKGRVPAPISKELMAEVIKEHYTYTAE